MRYFFHLSLVLTVRVFTLATFFFLPLQILMLKSLLILTIDKFIHYGYDAIRTLVDTRDTLGIYV